MKKCNHLNCFKIYTRESLKNIIIDTNYQCNICGKIFTVEQYQKILTDNCSFCNGSGIHEDQGNKYNCGSKK